MITGHWNSLARRLRAILQYPIVRMTSFVVPELHLLKDADEQIRACENCLKVIHRKWRFVGAAMSISVFLGIFIYYRLSLLVNVSPMILPGALIVWVALTFLAPLWLCRNSMRRSIREHLNASGIRLCLDCGYNLKGNVSGICPECGERI